MRGNFLNSNQNLPTQVGACVGWNMKIEQETLELHARNLIRARKHAQNLCIHIHAIHTCRLHSDEERIESQLSPSLQGDGGRKEVHTSPLLQGDGGRKHISPSLFKGEGEQLRTFPLLKGGGERAEERIFPPEGKFTILQGNGERIEP